MIRNLLHISKLQAFKDWMDLRGIEWRPARGDYQVLQILMLKGGWACVYYRAVMPEHFTVDRRLEQLVWKFIEWDRGGSPKEQAAKLPVEIAITTTSDGKAIDEKGCMFDSGWYTPKNGHPGHMRIL